MPEVQLRAMCADDEDRVLAWRNQDDVRRYMYNDRIIAADSHRVWFSAALKDDSAHYWIVMFNAEPVGLVTVSVTAAHKRGVWAYYLAEASTRGQGVGACTEYMVIERVFGELGLEELWCEVLVSNEAVWKLHQSFGFVIEATLRQHVIKSDGPHDVLGLGLLKADWSDRRAACAERLRAKGFTL